MSYPRFQLRDQYEVLAWQISGALLIGLVAIWLGGLWFHGAQLAEQQPVRGAAELLRADATRPSAVRIIRFNEVAGRDLVAVDAENERAIKPLGFERDGFVVSIVRSLDRERRRIGIAAGAPYRLSRWNNGQLLLEDPETGGQIELSAFGSTNAEAFATLLTSKADKAQR